MDLVREQSGQREPGVARRRAVAWTTGVLVVATVSILAAINLSSAANSPFHITPVKPGSIAVTRIGSHAFPVGTCASEDPSAVMLPAAAIPDMALGTPVTAEGNVPLDPSSFVTAQGEDTLVPSIAADLSENLISEEASDVGHSVRGSVQRHQSSCDHQF